MAKKATFVLDEVLAHFDELEDPRSPVNLLHPLPSVIVVALLAVLSGADGPTAIHIWAKARAELLLKCKRPVKRMLQLSLSFPVFREVSDGKAAFGGTMGTVDF